MQLKRVVDKSDSLQSASLESLVSELTEIAMCVSSLVLLSHDDSVCDGTAANLSNSVVELDDTAPQYLGDQPLATLFNFQLRESIRRLGEAYRVLQKSEDAHQLQIPE
jgi:hypothetical protein